MAAAGVGPAMVAVVRMGPRVRPSSVRRVARSAVPLHVSSLPASVATIAPVSRLAVARPIVFLVGDISTSGRACRS